MAYKDDDVAAIWPNRKRKTDKHPHYTGTAKVGGVEYYVSAWRRGEDANEKAPVMRLAFTPVEKTGSQEHKGATTATPPAQEVQDFDDDIPF